MPTKKSTYAAQFKAGDGETGTFEALVSIFGNVDLQGDRVMPGAFKKTIAAWRKSGDPVPVVFSHDWADPFAHIGYAEPKNIRETDEGLFVKGHLDIGDNPTAAQIYKLMKRRSLREFSFAYEIQKEKVGEDGANELHALDILEVGPTLKGANPETQLLAVKTHLEETLPAKAVDNSEWDGNRAMGQANTAEEYRSICAGVRDVGEPDERQHWALPHHYLGRGPNAAGTRNALARLPQTEGLANREAAQAHLEAHMREINPDRASLPMAPAKAHEFRDALNALLDEYLPATGEENPSDGSSEPKNDEPKANADEAKIDEFPTDAIREAIAAATAAGDNSNGR